MLPGHANKPGQLNLSMIFAEHGLEQHLRVASAESNPRMADGGGSHLTPSKKSRSPQQSAPLFSHRLLAVGGWLSGMKLLLSSLVGVN